MKMNSLKKKVAAALVGMSALSLTAPWAGGYGVAFAEWQYGWKDDWNKHLNDEFESFSLASDPMKQNIYEYNGPGTGVWDSFSESGCTLGIAQSS